MDTAKPAPMMVGGKPLYSLSSYEPVEVEVMVPFTSDAEVELAVSSMVAEEGGDANSLSDAEWLAKHFEGLRSADEVHRVVRARLREMNSQFAEDQKRDKCLLALAERLNQSVAPEQLEATRAGIYANMKQRAAASGMTMEAFMERGGVSAADFDAMLDTQAAQTAQIDAALSAYARENKITAAESEYAQLLGMPADAAKNLIGQARATGHLDEIRDAAVRAKAAQAVVGACRCTYHHETEAEAAERLKMLRDLMAQSDR